jgi:hypothetical protein
MRSIIITIITYNYRKDSVNTMKVTDSMDFPFNLGYLEPDSKTYYLVAKPGCFARNCARIASKRKKLVLIKKML